MVLSAANEHKIYYHREQNLYTGMTDKIKWKIFIGCVQNLNKNRKKTLHIKGNNLTGGKICCMI